MVVVVIVCYSLESVFLRSWHGIPRISEDWNPLRIGVSVTYYGYLYMCATFFPPNWLPLAHTIHSSNTELILAVVDNHASLGFRVFGHYGLSLL